MRIIKLGGSLANSGQLSACLAHIASVQTMPTVIVPGGGEFAEQVRIAQQHWHFNDVAAHYMAILAMQQMAVLLNALQPAWPLLNTLNTLQQTAQTGIWFPEIALLNQQGIPASWDVTSDSLAAWLAGALAASELIVVKAAACKAGTTLSQFVELGIVDAAFLDYTQDKTYKITIINSHDFLNYI